MVISDLPFSPPLHPDDAAANNRDSGLNST
jgi:hypothetical protein